MNMVRPQMRSKVRRRELPDLRKRYQRSDSPPVFRSSASEWRRLELRPSPAVRLWKLQGRGVPRGHKGWLPVLWAQRQKRKRK